MIAPPAPTDNTSMRTTAIVLLLSALSAGVAQAQTPPAEPPDPPPTSPAPPADAKAAEPPPTDAAAPTSPPADPTPALVHTPTPPTPAIGRTYGESISLASGYSSVRESSLNTLLLPRGGLE